MSGYVAFFFQLTKSDYNNHLEIIQMKMMITDIRRLEYPFEEEKKQKKKRSSSSN